MSDAKPSSLTAKKNQRAIYVVRRRFYVSSVVGLAMFFVGLMYWPLNASTYRTSCQLDVKLNTDFAQQNPQQSTNKSFEKALRNVIQKTMTEGTLAACIRRSAEDGTESIASMRVPMLRQALDIRIVRPRDSRALWRRITIAMTGNGDLFERRVVDEIQQDLAGRLSREANWSLLDQTLQKNADLIARKAQQSDGNLLELVSQTRQQCDIYQRQLDTLAQSVGSIKFETNETVLKQLQDQAIVVERRVVQSDLDLATELERRIVGQYGKDGSNPLLQHVKNLIEDRQEILANIVPTPTGVSHSKTALVKANPFAFASQQKKVDSKNKIERDQLQQRIRTVDLSGAYKSLGKLRRSLEDRSFAKIQTVSIAKRIEGQTGFFSIMDSQSALAAKPIDGRPTIVWIVLLAISSSAVGVAFSLGWHPATLSKQLVTPGQLATYLGLQHLGSAESKREKPGLFTKILGASGISIFRTAELTMLLFLCCMIVAIVWDNSLPALLFSRPLDFFCQAVWVLLGR